MAQDLSVVTLQEPLAFPFSAKRAQNRFSKAPTTERLCTYSDDEFARGEPTRELERVYEIWGKGGLGILHTGNIMLHRARLEAPGCAIIDPDMPNSYVPAFARLQRAATSQSPTPPLLIGQLAYLGGPIPSDNQEHPLIAAEGALQSDTAHWTREDIKDVVRRFAFAAGVLKDAGFDGAQIHGAYGNLITQFLSRRVNTRTDEYGGSLENRSRILLEIIAAFKERVGDRGFVLGVKLYAKDFADGGLPSQEPQELARMLEDVKVDYIDLSGGAYEAGHEASELITRLSTSLMAGISKLNPSRERFLLFAQQIRSGLTKTRLIVTGGFKTAEFMINAVKSGVTDFIGLGRSLTHEPSLAADILAGRTSHAKRNRLPASLAINLDAGISQIQRMGRGLELRDFSDENVVDEWMREMG